MPCSPPSARAYPPRVEAQEGEPDGGQPAHRRRHRPLYGVGKKYRKAVVKTDEQIKRFVKQQKKLGLWSRTVMFIVSDHSMATNERKTSLTEVFTAAGIPSSSYLIVAERRDQLRVSGRALVARPQRPAAPDAAGSAGRRPGTRDRRALYRDPNPLDGDTVNTLDAVHPGWHLAGPRTGDLVVTQTAGGAFTDPINPWPAATVGRARPTTCSQSPAAGRASRRTVHSPGSRAPVRRHGTQPDPG